VSIHDDLAAAIRPPATPAAGAPRPVAGPSPLQPGGVTAISGAWPNQIFSVAIGGAPSAATNLRALSSYGGAAVGDVVWLLPIGNTDGPDWLILGSITSPAWAPGDVKWASYSTPDPGWVLADGTLYSTTGIYAALFARTGYTHGGSGANFRVVDLRGRFPMGAGAGVGLTTRTLGITGGEENHILTEAELAVHSHVTHSTGSTNATHTHAGVGGMSEIASPNAGNVTNIVSDGAGSNSGHNTIPPFVALTPMVKL
jgi:microcystin-dependent protein